MLLRKEQGLHPVELRKPVVGENQVRTKVRDRGEIGLARFDATRLEDEARLPELTQRHLGIRGVVLDVEEPQRGVGHSRALNGAARSGEASRGRCRSPP